MSESMWQKIINLNVKTYPKWHEIFTQRQYEYLAHVINGLVDYGGDQSDEVLIQYGQTNERNILHIFEPFRFLNQLGFWSPSVVSIAFKKQRNDQVDFFCGQNNGLGIFSSELYLQTTSKIPRNSTQEIDFWHFVDAICVSSDDDCDLESV